MHLTSIFDSFSDELEKIAGFSRIGRRPMTVSTLLKRTPKKAEMVKKAEGEIEVSKKLKLDKAVAGAKKYQIPLIAAGSIIGYDQLRKAKRDWETGRAMRLQSGY